MDKGNMDPINSYPNDNFGGAIKANARKNIPSNSNIKDVQNGCEKVFQLLRSHPSAYLFLMPLSPDDPKFNELSSEFINLI